MDLYFEPFLQTAAHIVPAISCFCRMLQIISCYEQHLNYDSQNQL